MLLSNTTREKILATTSGIEAVTLHTKTNVLTTLTTVFTRKEKEKLKTNQTDNTTMDRIMELINEDYVVDEKPEEEDRRRSEGHGKLLKYVSFDRQARRAVGQRGFFLSYNDRCVERTWESQ